jgi:aarF domain-containing kinase
MGGYTYYYYTIRKNEALEQIAALKKEAVVVPTPPEPERFRHPYDSSSTLFRWFFSFRRVCYLLYLFIPLSFVGFLVYATGVQEGLLRRYFVRLMVSTLQSAGCTFQKMGQFLSMRPDMVPPDFVEALATLRDGVRPHTLAETEQILRDAFGCELEDIFEEFDPKPVASGTVAQVYRAKLNAKYAKTAHIYDKYGNSVVNVAVKVRHPCVLDETWLDIPLLYSIYKKIPGLAGLTMPFSEDDFIYNIQKQINFEWEAHSLCLFARNFKEELKRGVGYTFPAVSPTLLTQSVLVESWAPGKPISVILDHSFGAKTSEVNGMLGVKIAKLKKKFTDHEAAKKKELAEQLYDMTIKMFLRDNLIHSDLHAGNIVFDVDSGTCTVLDAGLTCALAPEVKQPFAQFVRALCNGDAEMLFEKILQFEVSEKGSKDPGPIKHDNIEEIRRDVHRAVGAWVDPKALVHSAPDGGPISLGDLIGELLFSLTKHHVILRGDVALCILAMAVSEGLIRSLDPEVDVVSKAFAYMVKYPELFEEYPIDPGFVLPTLPNLPKLTVPSLGGTTENQ